MFQDTNAGRDAYVAGRDLIVNKVVESGSFKCVLALLFVLSIIFSPIFPFICGEIRQFATLFLLGDKEEISKWYRQLDTRLQKYRDDSNAIKTTKELRRLASDLWVCIGIFEIAYNLERDGRKADEISVWIAELQKTSASILNQIEARNPVLAKNYRNLPRFKSLIRPFRSPLTGIARDYRSIRKILNSLVEDAYSYHYTPEGIVKYHYTPEGIVKKLRDVIEKNPYKINRFGTEILEKICQLLEWFLQNREPEEPRSREQQANLPVTSSSSSSSVTSSSSPPPPQERWELFAEVSSQDREPEKTRSHEQQTDSDDLETHGGANTPLEDPSQETGRGTEKSAHNPLDAIGSMRPSISFPVPDGPIAPNQQIAPSTTPPPKATYSSDALETVLHQPTTTSQSDVSLNAEASIHSPQSYLEDIKLQDDLSSCNNATWLTDKTVSGGRLKPQ